MPWAHRAELAGLLAAALLPSTAFATVIPGGSLSTQTWTAAGSPYQVQGDITIPAGVTLTVEAGIWRAPGGAITTRLRQPGGRRACQVRRHSAIVRPLTGDRTVGTPRNDLGAYAQDRVVHVGGASAR